MTLALMFASLVAGGSCGLCAFHSGYGLIESLVIYAVAGQVIMLVAPFLARVLRPRKYLRQMPDLSDLTRRHTEALSSLRKIAQYDDLQWQ